MTAIWPYVHINFHCLYLLFCTVGLQLGVYSVEVVSSVVWSHSLTPEDVRIQYANMPMQNAAIFKG